MKCRAAIYQQHPGVVPHIETFPSMKAVEDDFLLFALQCDGAMPVADIYYYDTDEMIMRLSVSDKGFIVKERL